MYSGFTNFSWSGRALRKSPAAVPETSSVMPLLKPPTRCVCVFTKPGSTALPGTRIVLSGEKRSRRSLALPTSTIRLPSMATAPLRITAARSASGITHPPSIRIFATSFALLRLDVRELDRLPHQLELCAQELAQPLRRAAFGEGALGEQLVLEALPREGLVQHLAQRLDDLRRHAGRPHHRGPGRQDHFGIAGLHHGGRVRQEWRALRRRDRDGLELARLDLGQRHENHLEQHVYVSAQHVGDRLR